LVPGMSESENWLCIKKEKKNRGREDLGYFGEIVAA